MAAKKPAVQAARQPVSVYVKPIQLLIFDEVAQAGKTPPALSKAA